MVGSLHILRRLAYTLAEIMGVFGQIAQAVAELCGNEILQDVTGSALEQVAFKLLGHAGELGLMLLQILRQLLAGVGELE
jgi:hypothetical protein